MFSSFYEIFARETVRMCIYTRYLAGVRNSAIFSHINSRSTEGDEEKRARRKRRDTGIDAEVSFDNPVTFRCRWGVFTACGLTNPLSFLHFRTALALPLALPNTHVYTLTNKRIPLSLSFLLPLRSSLHPFADQSTFYSAQRMIPPDFEPTGLCLPLL